MDTFLQTEALVNDQLIQVPLIELGQNSKEKEDRKKRKVVNETLNEIYQLKDKLNIQLASNPTERPAIHSPGDGFKLLDSFIGFLDHEELWVIDLDTRNRVQCFVQLYKGSVNSSQVRAAEVFRQAIIDNSNAILIAHNHPSGDLSPSPEDVALTRTLRDAGKLLDIELLDHLIISYGRYASLKEKGYGF